MTGMVYLVQPCELVGTNRIKIGMSSISNFSRIKNGYRKGTLWLSESSNKTKNY